MTTVTFASLFSGVGGLDWGFHAAGARLVGAWDMAAVACSTYSANFGVTPEERDILSVSSADVKGAQLILAGPPCQGFSSLAGREPSDPRNRLIVSAAKLIAAAQPSAFVIENVPGLQWQANGRYIRETLKMLTLAQFRVQLVHLDCSRLGLPQRRRRILIVGGRKQVGERLIAAVMQLVDTPMSPRMVADVLLPEDSLFGLPNHEPKALHTTWYESVIRAIGPGQKLCDTRLGPASVHSWDIPEVFGKTSERERALLVALARIRRSEKNRRYVHIGDGRAVTIRQLADAASLSKTQVTKDLTRLLTAGYVERLGATHYDLARRFNGRFKRLPLQGVSPAVLKEFGWPRSTLHPTLARGLTVRECARLQGFPDNFRFVGSRSDQYQMVANAFPPAISALFAPAVLSALASKSLRGKAA